MVVTLTYNHAPYIEDTLKGIIMQQTNFPIVACVLDDCSTDGTADIVRRYEAQYPDLIKGFYFQENQYSQGKNTGDVLWNWVTRTKYIAFCEGDDYWTDPLKLQKQVDFMESHAEYSLCFHNAKIHFEGKPEEDGYFPYMADREYYAYEVFEKWNVTTASVVIRAEIMDFSLIQPLLSNKSFMQSDVVLWCYCATKGKIYGMKEIMSVYRRLNNGYTSLFQVSIYQNLDLLYRYCIHNESLLAVFGDALGKEFSREVEKLFFSYNSYGLAYSFSSLKCNYFVKFLRQSLSHSFKKTIESIMRIPRIFVGVAIRNRFLRLR